MPPEILYWCKNCQMYVESVYYETGYENCQFPTAFEDYYCCPKCKKDISIVDNNTDIVRERNNV